MHCRVNEDESRRYIKSEEGRERKRKGECEGERKGVKVGPNDEDERIPLPLKDCGI